MTLLVYKAITGEYWATRYVMHPGTGSEESKWP